MCSRGVEEELSMVVPSDSREKSSVASHPPNGMGMVPPHSPHSLDHSPRVRSTVSLKQQHHHSQDTPSIYCPSSVETVPSPPPLHSSLIPSCASCAVDTNTSSSSPFLFPSFPDQSSSLSPSQSPDSSEFLIRDLSTPRSSNRIKRKKTGSVMAKVWRGLRPVPDYRLWIYSVNCLIILFQMLVGLLYYRIVEDPFWSLVPIPPTSSIFIVYGSIFFVQWCACVCGVIGVFISSRHFIRVYWLLMIPLLFIDVVTFAMTSYELMKVHVSYTQHPSLAVDSSLCPTWEKFSHEFSCWQQCSIDNATVPLNSNVPSCTYELLRWMHNRLDCVGILLYFVLFPLKLIVILALREDIQELFVEIVYSDNERLFKHWALGDEEDMRDRDQTEEQETVLTHSNNVYGA